MPDRATSAEVDQHIERCETCGDGEGVCLTGYLLAVREQDDAGDAREDPEVVYYPGAHNHYDYYHNVVVLDSRLKEYPKAHDLIKQHELRHAERRTAHEILVLELKTDLRKAFSRDAAVGEAREYFHDAAESPYSLPFYTEIGKDVVQLARPFWQAVLVPSGWLYRTIRSLGGDDRDA